jgi:hypothetical protein
VAMHGLTQAPIARASKRGLLRGDDILSCGHSSPNPSLVAGAAPTETQRARLIDSCYGFMSELLPYREALALGAHIT